MDVCKWKRQLQEAIRNLIPLNTDIAVTGKRGKEDEQIPSRLLVHSQDPHMPFICVPSLWDRGITHPPPIPNTAATEGENMHHGTAALTWVELSHPLFKSPGSTSRKGYTAFYLLYSKQSSCQDKAMVCSPAWSQAYKVTRATINLLSTSLL